MYARVPGNQTEGCLGREGMRKEGGDGRVRYQMGIWGVRRREGG